MKRHGVKKFLILYQRVYFYTVLRVTRDLRTIRNANTLSYKLNKREKVLSIVSGRRESKD